MELKFYKVTSLPGTPEANAFYFVENGNYAESYLTDDAGVAKMIGNSNMITQIAGTGSQEVILAADIAARDLLTLTTNTTVYVVDASGDATVNSGGAFYFWDNAGTQWYKLAEFESMDVTLEWANIQNKPTSSASAIDAAVTNSHTHGNKPVLDAITDAGSGQVITAGERTAIGANSAASHSHANKTQLDLISEVNGVAGYNGVEIKNWNTVNW